MNSGIIFRGKDVSVRADIRDTQGLVVSFSNFAEEESELVAFGDGAVQSKGYSAVFLTANGNNWWQSAEMEQACAAIRALAGGFDVRIAYGSSMGGYGALAFGSATGCKRILAISPQTVISDPAIPLNAKWRAAIASRPIIRDDIPADLGELVPEIMFDPHSAEDSAHVAWLRSRAAIREQHYPYAGHKLLQTLRECGILGKALAAWFREGAGAPELAEDYQQTQHRSPRYFMNLGTVVLRAGDVAQARAHAEAIMALGDEECHRVLVNRIEHYEKQRAPRPAPSP